MLIRWGLGVYRLIRVFVETVCLILVSNCELGS